MRSLCKKTGVEINDTVKGNSVLNYIVGKSPYKKCEKKGRLVWWGGGGVGWGGGRGLNYFHQMVYCVAAI